MVEEKDKGVIPAKEAAAAVTASTGKKSAHESAGGSAYQIEAKRKGRDTLEPPRPCRPDAVDHMDPRTGNEPKPSPAVEAYVKHMESKKEEEDTFKKDQERVAKKAAKAANK
jgi:hypothetical protein